MFEMKLESQKKIKLNLMNKKIVNMIVEATG